MSVELERCPLCGAEEQEQVFFTRDRHYGIPGFFRIVRCKQCSLVFLNPMYCHHELAAFYPDDYYAYQDNFYLDAWKEKAKRILGLRLATRDPQFAMPGRVLDLGCGSGSFVLSMLQRGWDAYGVEISRAAAEVGRSKAGLNIFCGQLEDARFAPEFFDYIRSNHSFEHLSCPSQTLQEIYRILKPEGKLMIAVPNIDSINATVFGQYWWYLGAPLHPFLYSVDTLCGMLRRSRFAIENVQYNSDYSGILGSFQIWINRKNGRKSSEGRVITNPFLKVLSQWAAKMLDLCTLGDAIEVTARKE